MEEVLEQLSISQEMGKDFALSFNDRTPRPLPQRKARVFVLGNRIEPGV